MPRIHTRAILCALLIAALTATVPAAPPEPTDAETPAPAVTEATMTLACESLVTVHMTLQKDTSDDADDGAAPPWARPGKLNEPSEAWGPGGGFGGDGLDAYIDEKMTLDVSGVVIAPGEVLIPDRRINPACISRIEVRSLDGETFEAAPGWILAACDAVVLKVLDPGKKLKPLQFHEIGPVTLRTSIQTVSLTRVEQDWCVTTGGLPVTLVRPGTSPWLAFGDVGSGPVAAPPGSDDPMILTDGEDRPVGVTAACGVDSTERFGAWIGKHVLASARIPLTDLKQHKQRLRDDVLKSVHEVAVKFRNSREHTFFGVAIDEKRILIPAFLDRKGAARIDRITVKRGHSERLAATFVGAYKEFGAFLVELTDETFEASVPLAPATAKRGEPFWTATPRKRHADKYLDIDYARLTHQYRGYRNDYYWDTDRALAPGDLLLDDEGRLFGLFMKQRIEDEESKRAAAAAENRYEYAGDENTRVFLASEFGRLLADPTGAIDETIVVKSRLESRRRPWFGVEYVTLTAEIAEQLNVARPTRDGAIGLLVNAVYAGSPAAAAGIVEGDILLKLTGEAVHEPIELADGSGRGSTGFWGSFWGGGRQSHSMAGEEGAAEQTWKSRKNFLTNLLDAIGVGKNVTIRYCRMAADGRLVEREATVGIQLSPPDNDAARRWKNRRIGLTVKDLTYEIRNALSLADDAPGVVVDAVESGSPASIARLWPNEIVTHANGTPLREARHLQRVIAAARRSGSETVRLTVLRLGRSRFADLRIVTYSPEDDEGLDDK